MTAETVPIIIGFWIICGIAAGLITQSRHTGDFGQGFALGIILGPLGVLFALIQKPKDPVPFAAPTPSLPAGFCPSCGKPRASDARFCASCGGQLA